jgi:hypothetical protein
MLIFRAGKTKPWALSPGKLYVETAMPPTMDWSKKRVIRLITQENRFKVIKLIGRSNSLIIGLTILFRRSQMTAADTNVFVSWRMEKPG